MIEIFILVGQKIQLSNISSEYILSGLLNDKKRLILVHIASHMHCSLKKHLTDDLISENITRKIEFINGPAFIKHKLCGHSFLLDLFFELHTDFFKFIIVYSVTVLNFQV